VGNGALALLRRALALINGQLGIVVPSFEAYSAVKKGNLIYYCSPHPNFSYTAEDLIDYFDDKEIGGLLLINPDNPTGNYIEHAGVLRLAEWAKEKGIYLVVDESFVDFVDAMDTLINEKFLNEYPEVVVVKSMSKSFGVPGFRLGILACGSQSVVMKLKEYDDLWNNNSFSECFLHILDKYRSEYFNSLHEFQTDRLKFVEKLKHINIITPFKSRTNYVMCELLRGTSWMLASLLLNRYNILVKNLTSKNFVNGQYVRISIRQPEENQKLIHALNEIQFEHIMYPEMVDEIR
jgi:histidinol-phosphate/aromatic aminotransferase/cobyric acid decarboxylase-like protein